MDDLIAELERAQRRVAAEELHDAPAHVVELRRTFRAGVADVWDACTDPDRVRRWFLPLTGDLRAGGRFQLEGNAGGLISRCEPPHRLEVTWEFGGATPGLLTVDLGPAGEEATELVLRHTVPDDDHWKEYGPGAVGVGWDLALLGLVIFLAGGDRPENGEFMADPAAVAFMRRSATEWGAAQEAAGADPDTAAQAAASTSTAYAPGPG